MDAIVVVGVALLPVIAAFVMDQARDRIAEQRLGQRLDAARIRDGRLAQITDTEGTCRARVAWLQLRGTYPDQSWAYMQLLVSAFPNKDMRLLGEGYRVFIAGCDRMFREPLLTATEPTFGARIISEAMKALKGQRELVEAGRSPVLADESAMGKVDSEHAEFMAAQGGAGDASATVASGTRPVS